jgi:signal transduction histidine kinase/ActR/RegA family two-component response regulator
MRVPTESPSSALAQSRKRTLARLRAVIGLAFALPLLGLAVIAGLLYHEAFREANERIDTATRIAQEHAQKMLETNEMVLARMLDLLGGASDAEILARSAEVHERLKELARGLPQVQGLYMHGADARSLGTDRVFPPPRQINYSDREWYLAHRDGEGDGFFITEQLKSRATGESFFDLSRRRDLAGGKFAGTVHISLRPEYLTAFWKEMERALPGLRVSLLRADGRFIARHPGLPGDGATLGLENPLMQHMTRGVTGGTYESTSAFDRVAHVVAFRKLGKYPVYVAAGLSRAAIVAGWARQVVFLSLFVVPLACALAWMAWLALRRTREELDAVQRLEDETARRQRTELALAQSQKLETVGQLAGGVAHDFNNLLMIVSNNLHLLRQRGAQGAGERELASMERAVGSGARLTRQLLALAGRQALAPERVRLQERMPGMLDLVRAALPRSIELTAHVAADTAAVLIDPAELELALINLALNARDAIDGGGRIEVSARNTLPEEGAEQVVIEMADAGRGIDPALLERVLEPFFTTKSSGKGTGLGLTQVQALCRNSGGRVEIAARPGGGTRVRLFFPQASGGPDEREAAADAPLPRLHCKLLLVEDNDALAHVTAAVLESLGCEVQRAESAHAALQALDGRRFDVVLSDIEMPGKIDGIELAERLARHQRPLPVVLMSGYASRIEQAKALGLRVLAKPCAPAVLRAAIGDALAQRPAPDREAAAS